MSTPPATSAAAKPAALEIRRMNVLLFLFLMMCWRGHQLVLYLFYGVSAGLGGPDQKELGKDSGGTSRSPYRRPLP
jgi:hypothetical protein